MRDRERDRPAPEAMRKIETTGCSGQTMNTIIAVADG
jgi:hypothetical protein